MGQKSNSVGTFVWETVGRLNKAWSDYSVEMQSVGIIYVKTHYFCVCLLLNVLLTLMDNGISSLHSLERTTVQKVFSDVLFFPLSHRYLFVFNCLLFQPGVSVLGDHVFSRVSGYVTLLFVHSGILHTTGSISLFTTYFIDCFVGLLSAVLSQPTGTATLVVKSISSKQLDQKQA